jgi:hypothetical protein
LPFPATFSTQTTTAEAAADNGKYDDEQYPQSNTNCEAKEVSNVLKGNVIY